VALTFEQAMTFQARFCDDAGAPLTARVCRALARALDGSSITGARALSWPGDPIDDALPLRLVAPFHALFRAGRCAALGPLFRGEAANDVACIAAAVAAHDAEIAGWLDGPPQTNEPGRSATFMAGLLLAAQRFGHPFELLEIGSSAGLNLLIDRYRYRLGGVEVGPPDATVTIAPEWRGPPPPSAQVTIANVRGVDIAPIDVGDAVQAERLLAYVWVDTPERSARVEAGIAMIRSAPPRLERGDAADWVEARFGEEQAAGTTRVLLHSIVWQYLPPATQARITATLEDAGQRATHERALVWLRFENGWSREVRMTVWPGGEDTLIAHAHPHGTWIEWLAPNATS